MLMAIVVDGMYLARELRNALNIDRDVRSIVIEADCSKAASVTIEFLPTPEESKEIGTILQKFALMEIEEVRK
jgi:hypothetical protein